MSSRAVIELERSERRRPSCGPDRAFATVDEAEIVGAVHLALRDFARDEAEIVGAVHLALRDFARDEAEIVGAVHLTLRDFARDLRILRRP